MHDSLPREPHSWQPQRPASAYVTPSSIRQVPAARNGALHRQVPLTMGEPWRQMGWRHAVAVSRLASQLQRTPVAVLANERVPRVAQRGEHVRVDALKTYGGSHRHAATPFVMVHSLYLRSVVGLLITSAVQMVSPHSSSVVAL